MTDPALSELLSDKPNDGWKDARELMELARVLGWWVSRHGRAKDWIIRAGRKAFVTLRGSAWAHDPRDRDDKGRGPYFTMVMEKGKVRVYQDRGLPRFAMAAGGKYDVERRVDPEHEASLLNPLPAEEAERRANEAMRVLAEERRRRSEARTASNGGGDPAV